MRQPTSSLPEHVRVIGLLLLVAMPADIMLLRAHLAPSNDPTFGDFLGFWSYGRMVVQHHAASIYHPAVVAAVQQALQPGIVGGLPFFYPPPMLFLVAPLGGLSQPIAFAAWEGVGLGAWLLATFAAPVRPRMALLALALPTTLVAILFGQSGLLVGAFLLGGLRLVPVRPVLGGLLLGLVAVKPQLGLFVPLALLAAGRWRALAAAAASAVLLALLSGLCFGWHAWGDWLGALPIAEAQWHDDIATRFRYAPTPQASLLMMGTPVPLLRAVQCVCLALAAGLVWRACRPGLDARALVVTFAAVFLASPYAMIYDLPALVGAILLFFGSERGTQGERFAALGIQALPVLALVGVAPLVMPAIILFVLLVFAALRLPPFRWSIGPAWAARCRSLQR